MNKLSLRTKLNILIVLVILAVSLALMFTGYRAYCRKIDAFLFERCEEAAIAVSDNGSRLTQHLWDAINTDEFRQVRQRAVAENDEEIIREWMQSNDLYDKYEKLVESYNEARKEFEEADIYVQYCQNGITYTLVDPQDNLLSIGAEEEKLPEFAGYADNERIPPTVYRSGDGWLCTACEPIKDKTGKVVGLACADMDMNDVIQQRHWFLLNCAIFVLIEMAVSILISMFLVGKFVTSPLKQLAGAARKFGSISEAYTQNDVMQLPIRSNDEIGDLYRAFLSMQNHIVENTQKLTAITAQQERIDTELRMAAQIQSSMLPSDYSILAGKKEIDLYACMEPARETAGDFYDFFLADDDHLVLTMADVSGKGLPAALFTALCKIILSQQAKMGKSPARILKDANIEICANNRQQMFVTVWLGILEISTGILCFADAGHEKPLLKRDGKWEFIEKEKSGIPLGLFSESPDGAELFTEQTITLHAGDVLFQYTDGVTEAVHEKKLFGEAGLLSAVSGAKSAKPEELLACIRQQIDGFVGQEPQFDDITMMGLMYNGIYPTAD